MHHGAIAAEISAAIRVARVLCISLMMFTHVWPGATRILAAEVPPVLHDFYVIAINELARASVPLLSIVSGLLFFRTIASARRPVALIADKARSLLVPMVIWSALLLFMVIVEAAYTSDAGFFAVGPLTWLNRVFALTTAPINLPLAFLRDTFLSCCIVLAAQRLGRTLPGAANVALVLYAALEMATGGLLLLRPQILLFFVLGFLAARLPPEKLAVSWFIVLLVYTLDLLLRLGVTTRYWTGNLTELWQVLHRLAVALLLWRTAISIVRSAPMLRDRLTALEPIIFLAFCSHMLTISVIAATADLVGMRVENPAYPLLFLAQVPTAIAVAWMIAAIGQKHFPRLLEFSTGRRRTRLSRSRREEVAAAEDGQGKVRPVRP